MRHASNNRRSRNHNRGGNPNRGGGQPYNRNQVFDSNGPDVRIRGTAHQICEKYMTLAKDATSVGDIVMAESYMQHAEHYQRVINSWAAEQPAYTPPAEAKQDDDLSLPTSILGSDIKQSDQGSEQPERMLERA